MTTSSVIRCRAAACRVAHTGAWDFFLINDSDAPLNSAVLTRVSYEWGNQGHSDTAEVRVSDLSVGAFERIWRDDGDGVEGRMELSLQVRTGEREVALLFEFPILYKKTELPLVDGLGKPGWESFAAG